METIIEIDRKSMLANFSLRKATKDDINFVIEAIIEAEKGCSNQISTCSIFALSEDEYKEILRDILIQDIEHFDYYLSGYLIAESNGLYIGASGSWLEGAEGISSGIIRSSVLFPYLDKSKISEINKNTKIISGITIPREAGALQIEYVYIRKQFRGKGVFSQVVKENISRNLLKYNFSKVQSILFKDNIRSYNAFSKLGYKIVEERSVNEPDILKYFPYNTKVLMELRKDRF